MKRLMIVDDDPIILELLGEILSDTFALVKSLSSLEALEILKKDSRLDLVITDVMMPEMNGVIFAYELRKYSAAPIFAISGLKEKKFVALGMDSNPFAKIIPKPIDPEQLLIELNSYFAKSS